MDGGEEVVVAFVVSGGDGTEVFELVKEPFDEVAISVEKWAERGHALAIGHRLDAGPCATCGQRRADRVAVVSAVGEQDTVLAERTRP